MENDLNLKLKSEMMMACENGDFNKIKSLNNKENIGILSSILVRNNHVDVLEKLIINDYLLKSDSLLNELTYLKNSQSAIKIMKLLVEKGVSLNNSSKIITSALNNNRHEIALFLVDNGGDINCSNDYILRYFIVKRDMETIKYLLEKGSDLTSSNHLPWTLLINVRDLTIIDYVLQKYPHLNDFENIAYAARQGDMQLTKHFINRGGKINEFDFETLEHVVIHEDLELIKLLILKTNQDVERVLDRNQILNSVSAENEINAWCNQYISSKALNNKLNNELNKEKAINKKLKI